ncbi:MAG TPA: hypothetical protein VFI03_06140 [Solirubrobacterales bacterium]|nr:hypothetical protein [Solirubrobacterales bacterium]
MALGALIALTVAGVAVAAKDTVVRAGTLVVTIDGSSGVSPKALSKSKYTPIAFTAAGSVATTDGKQPPPLKEVLLDAKNSAVNVKGYPTCTSGQLQSRDTQAVEAACKSAIIGKGSSTISVVFPEQAPIPGQAPLLVFNGGTSGGTTTFFIHAYLTQPITTAVVTTVKIKKAGSGLKTVTTIPKIAGGSGSVTKFSLKIDKKFTYKGKKVSVLSAKCVGGKITADVTAKFYDGSALSADVLRTCTSKP